MSGMGVGAAARPTESPRPLRGQRAAEGKMHLIREFPKLGVTVFVASYYSTETGLVWVEVEGNTYPLRRLLREHGLAWNGANRAWSNYKSKEDAERLLEALEEASG